jgi:hypothetical protein
MLPGQLDFFATAPSTTLVGLEVFTNTDCTGCGCNGAVLGSSAGPHCAAIHCVRCGRHRGWLPREAATFINGIIDHFGRPNSPVILRTGRGRIC